MKISVRNIVFAIIIIICVVALNFGVYWQFFRKVDNIDSTPDTPVSTEIQKQLANDFQGIFMNSLDYQGYDVNISGITKLIADKDLIYTWVTRESSIDNKYDLNLNIPRINISSTSAEKFNNAIKNTYVNKANSIIQAANNSIEDSIYTIYDIEYMGYINTNILSLVIKATLKEGNNPQRVIIQTYNYNLSTNEEVTFKQLLEIKGIQENDVKSSIISTVNSANEDANKLKNLGYNVYLRDISSDIYEIDNISTFILGNDNYLYVIFPYGNANFTDATDVVVF